MGERRGRVGRKRREGGWESGGAAARGRGEGFVFRPCGGKGGKTRRGSKALRHHVEEALLRLGRVHGEKKRISVRERVIETPIGGGIGGGFAEAKGGDGMIKRQWGASGMDGFQELNKSGAEELFFDGGVVASADG